jgi:hypothetical protein
MGCSVDEGQRDRGKKDKGKVALTAVLCQQKKNVKKALDTDLVF